MYDTFRSASPTHPPDPYLDQYTQETSLFEFPSDATFQIFRAPSTGVDPKDGETVHVSELIPNEGDYVLVSFAAMATDDWSAIRLELEIGDNLELNLLLVGAVERVHIASGLYAAGRLAGLHNVTNKPTHKTVFVPSRTLMRALGIDHGNRSRNALVLIRDGHVHATWVSSGEGDMSHNWSSILSNLG